MFILKILFWYIKESYLNYLKLLIYLINVIKLLVLLIRLFYRN